MTTVKIRFVSESGDEARADHKKNQAAVVFIHGFSGDAQGTWGDFPKYLEADNILSGWDIYAFGYDSSLLPSRKMFWSSPPPICTLADQFATSASQSILKDYNSLAILCHSMGGLVAQRALLDNSDLLQRVSHLIMYGTPSDGLEAASSFKFWSRQVRDMGRDSDFMQDLRARRQTLTGCATLAFTAVAGASDDFVPRESSIDPFEDDIREVVEGNHLTIVKPDARDHRSVQIAVNCLSGQAQEFGVLDAARQAVEFNQFSVAIERFEPHINDLDDTALVELALALEETGQQDRAVEILNLRQDTGSDPRAVLGGRLKRKWLHNRRTSDAKMAMDRYNEAYDMAVAAKDDGQAYYAAINLAFLKIAFGSASSQARSEGEVWADKALHHTGKVPVSKWQQATRGEACMVKGDIEGSMEGYSQALNWHPSQREVMSMAQQAYHLADLLYPPKADGSDQAADRLDAVFQRNTKP